MSTAPTPKRGEIWLVDFDPPVERRWVKYGQQLLSILRKSAVSRFGLWFQSPIGRQPLQIVLGSYTRLPMVQRLIQGVCADTFQTKSVSFRRFVRRLGQLTNDQTVDIALRDQNLRRGNLGFRLKESMAASTDDRLHTKPEKN